MSEHLIQEAPVERDGNGWWWHPGLAEFGDPDDGEAYLEAFEAWIAEQRLQVCSVEMEADPSAPADHPYWQDECHCLGWEPTPPEPRDGWFVLCIADTENGPCCWWARRVEE